MHPAVLGCKYSLLIRICLPSCLWLQLLQAKAEDHTWTLPNLDTVTIISGFNDQLGHYKDLTADITSARLAPDQPDFDKQVNSRKVAPKNLRQGRPRSASTPGSSTTSDAASQPAPRCISDGGCSGSSSPNPLDPDTLEVAAHVGADITRLAST
jgi:hypothetical protein